MLGAIKILVNASEEDNSVELKFKTDFSEEQSIALLKNFILFLEAAIREKTGDSLLNDEEENMTVSESSYLS